MTRACNAAGIALIKRFESCRLTAYRDQRGIWTLGWGHTGSDVYPGLTWTQEKADSVFLNDLLTRAEQPIERLVKVPVGDNMFAALCAFVYNIGQGNFGASSALSTLNQGDYTHTPAHMLIWDHVTIQGNLVVDAGLVRRRRAEVALWLTPDTPQTIQDNQPSNQPEVS